MLRETVIAAWNQTLKPDEIIVSDDCSTDNTIEVLRELQRFIPVLKIIENNENSGGVPNWNKVIDESRGDIIAWCSDDDRFLPNHLESVANFLLKHDDVSMVHAGFINVDQLEDGSEIRTNSVLKGVSEICIDKKNLIPYMTQFYNWPFHPSTWTFRRELWKDVGLFNPDFALADTDWFIRAALISKVVYLPTLDVLNRRHAGNWSNRVGAVAMQREFYSAMQAFTFEAGKDVRIDFNPKRQFENWVYTYRKYLIRIYISRSRAGQFDVANDCSLAIVESLPLLESIPPFIVNFLARFFSKLLYILQPILPGGRAKYRNLGVTVPR